MHSSREQNMVLGSLNPTFSPRILDLMWSVARPRSVVPALCLCPLLVSGLYVEQHRQRGPGERLVAMKDSQTVGSERPSDSCTEVSQLLQSLCLPVCLEWTVQESRDQVLTAVAIASTQDRPSIQ